MKILYVITRSDVIGGASIHLLDLASEMQLLGHDIVILVGGKGPFVEFAKKRGLTVQSLRYLVRPISPMNDLLAIYEITKSIRKFSPDLVHLHSSKAGLLGRIAARWRTVPAIFTAHGWAFADGTSRLSQKIYLSVERYLAHWSAKIITVSDFDRQLALDQGVGNPNLIVTVHNGVPDIKAKPVEKPILGKLKLIMVARFDAQKDQALLLEALAKLNSRGWTCEFVGDGPTLAECKLLAEELALGDAVVFSGFRDDVNLRISKSNVMVLSTKWEGLPLSVIEAMRGALVVVASNVGGVSELVAEGVSGFLVERSNVTAMKNAIEKLIDRDDLVFEMGVAGRCRYEEHFSFERMLSQTTSIYRLVAGK